MIAIVWALILHPALAGDGSLDLERGRAALEAQRTEDAREHALESLAADDSNHESYRLYVDVMFAGGLGPKGLIDAATLAWVDAPHKEEVTAVNLALKAGDVKTAVAGVRKIQTKWPNRPDLLTVLWDADVEHAKLTRERARLIELVSYEVTKKKKAVYAYRARRFLKDVGEDVAPAAKALADMGEEYAPVNGPMRRVERSETARQLAKEGKLELPPGQPDDVLDMAERLSANLLINGKGEAAAAMWVLHRARHESATAAVGHAAVLLKIKDYKGALEVADRAVVLAVDPSATDLAAIQDTPIREKLAAALVIRAGAFEGLGHPASAMVDLTIANQLVGEIIDDVLEERVRTAVVALKNQVQEQYGPPEPAVEAMAKSRQIAGVDPKAAMAPLGDALFLYCLPLNLNATAFTLLPWLPDLAEAYALQGQLFNKLSMPDQARVAATLATLLHDGNDVRAWRERAALHEEAGHEEAAFAAFATARGLHPADAEPFDYDTALERTYDGPGRWSAAADVVAQVMEKPAVAGSDKAVVYRNRLTIPPRPNSGSAMASGVTAPEVGSLMPAWSVKTETGGTISSKNLQGRTIILTFWASYCETCLQMLPELSTLARQLRREGHDVAVVGVSVDDDRGAYETVERIGQRWGELVYDPDLAVRLGVAALPSTWIVDAHGNVRYFVDSWTSNRHFGRQIRRVIIE